MKPSGPPVRCGKLARFAVLLLVLLVPAVVADARHGPATQPVRPHRVISYFVDKTSGTEWRVLDPDTGTDTLMGVLSARCVYWDSTEASVEYLSGNQVWRMRWEVGAAPWPILTLPSYDMHDWWFDDQHACWQAATLGGVPRAHAREEPPHVRCHSELWESDSDGANWRIVQADTQSCGGCFFCGEWSLGRSDRVHRMRAIGLGTKMSKTSLDGWGGSPVLASPPRGEVEQSPQWWFIPSREVPGRGLVYRIGTWPNGRRFIRAPFYLVDRRTGFELRLDTPEMRREDDYPFNGFEEQDGVVLMSGDRTYAFDLRTGRQLIRQSPYVVRHAVWVAAPSPPSVDAPGLQRLRERFR